MTVASESDLPARLDKAVSGDQERHLPGEAGVWVFILGDMLLFGLFFVTFAVYRSQDPDLFAQSHRALNQAFGLINTLILLTSSWFVAMAVQLGREGRGRAAVPLVGLALACGACFCAVKAVEYSEKLAQGIGVTSNDFFMFYFMFTGIHLVHVLIGMVVLVVLLVVSRKPQLTGRDIAVLEGGGAFWHLVDLLWIVLFCLFYLMQ